MLATIFGLILFAIPFLLIFCFKNRFLGFVYILGSVLSAHLIIAFVTQFFHIFLYPVIIIINCIIALGVLAIIKYKFRPVSFKFKINWWVLIGFLIIFFELWSVHFSYTGTVNTITGRQNVFANSYPYPYFSDEWSGVSLASYSISHNTLPTDNPLALNFRVHNFPNIFICFFSLLAELFLLFNLSPLFGYVWLAIAAGLIICFLIFILLKSYKVDSFIALVASLFTPYIINGANLPGLWYLIPFTVGVILFLISLIGFSVNNNILALAAGFFTLLLYPPLIVFVLPLFIVYLLTAKNIKSSRKLMIILGSVFISVLAIALIIYSQGASADTLINIALSSIWRLGLDNGIPSLYFWYVIPTIILPFAAFGLFKIFSKKDLFLITSVTIGIVFWIFYSFSDHFFFIDYARTVILTSYLIMILFGLGLNEIIIKIYPKLSDNVIFISKILIIGLFVLFSFSYTNHLDWQNLKLKVSGQTDVYVAPAPPANIYLSSDDLKLFRSISGARFLSVPWKSLVIGVATNNYPMSSKQSIVGTNFLTYNEFMNKSCLEKALISKKMKLSYIYSEPFDCEKFREIGQSVEGFSLYKFIK